MTKSKRENLWDIIKRTCRVKQEYGIMETVAHNLLSISSVSPNKLKYDNLEGGTGKMKMKKEETHLFSNLVKLCEVLEEYQRDLTVRQVGILAMVIEAPNTSILRADIFKRLEIGSGVLTRNLGKLEQKRMIIQEPWEEDSRQYIVKLDNKGEELVKQIIKLFEDEL